MTAPDGERRLTAPVISPALARCWYCPRDVSGPSGALVICGYPMLQRNGGLSRPRAGHPLRFTMICGSCLRTNPAMSRDRAVLVPMTLLDTPAHREATARDLREEDWWAPEGEAALREAHALVRRGPPSDEGVFGIRRA